MPHIVGNYQTRDLATPLFLLEITGGIPKKTDSRANNVKVVHHVGADRRMRRRLHTPLRRAFFGLRHSVANRAIAHASGSKLKAVVQLIPSLLAHQLLNACHRPLRKKATLEPRHEVVHRGSE